MADVTLPLSVTLNSVEMTELFIKAMGSADTRTKLMDTSEFKGLADTDQFKQLVKLIDDEKFHTKAEAVQTAAIAAAESVDPTTNKGDPAKVKDLGDKVKELQFYATSEASYTNALTLLQNYANLQGTPILDYPGNPSFHMSKIRKKPKQQKLNGESVYVSTTGVALADVFVAAAAVVAADAVVFAAAFVI